MPALTFAIAGNQQSEQNDLEDIGHYFHLNSLTANDITMIPRFAKTIERHYAQIKHLFKHTKFAIDGLGVNRVIQQLLSTEHIDQSSLYPLHDVSNADLTSESNNVLATLSEHHQLRQVCDQDINHYLTSRNLVNNSKNMIKTSVIPAIAHYTWWFNTKRESYLLTKDQQACLYIWHKIKQVATQNFLIGGWFVCHEKVDFNDALLALRWQLDYCQQHYPNISWLAVIHRENKFVKLLNKYMGFIDITPKHPNGTAIATLFPEASFNDFYFVEYSPDKDLTKT